MLESANDVFVKIWPFISDESNNRALSLVVAVLGTVLTTIPLVAGVITYRASIRASEDKEAADIIAYDLSDDHLEKRTKFRNAIELIGEVDFQSEDWKHLMRDINPYLNNLEYMAMRIQSRPRVKRELRRWMGSRILSDWDRSNNYIQMIRAKTKAPQVYEFLEKLVRSWSK
jgi:hypothetical protein